jgi:hypothetical protein
MKKYLGVKNMKHVSKWMAAVSCGMILSGSMALADDSTTNPTTGIDVVRGAVQQLEDELAKRGSQNELTSEEYKIWNKQFRAQLDQALNVYEEQLEVQIVSKLQPLTDQYNNILSQTVLRPDQVTALTSLTLVQLQTVASSLLPTKEGLYQQAFGKIFPFIPAAQITYVKGKSGHKISYHYEVSTLEPSNTSAMSGDCAVDDFRQRDPSSEADAKDMSISGALDLASACDYFKGKVPESDSREGFDYHSLFNHFVVPALKDGCSTQLCETLKQQDLVMTMESLAKNVDVSFVVKFSDENRAVVGYLDESGKETSINAASGASSARQEMMSYQYIDSTLPFSSSGK